MADDIDIEEHDLLENPRIKDILPHFNIKTEPVDLDEADYEEPSETYEEYYQPQEYEDNDTEASSYQDYTDESMEPYEHPQEVDNQQEDSDEIYHCNNKIILGSKPCSKLQIPIESNSKSQVELSFEVPGCITLGSKPSKFHRPIILGKRSRPEEPYIIQTQGVVSSKPCPKSKKPSVSEEEASSSTTLRALLTDEHEDPKFLEEPSPPRPERVLEDAVVFLEDWSVRLETSQCYCNECQTLFATRNALDAHNMTFHSFLVALDSPEMPMSPEAKTPGKERYCNQCQTHFDDDNSLIQHLYDHLTMQNERPSEKKERAMNERLFYRCPICYTYYVSLLRFEWHVTKNHNITVENIKKVPMNPICQFCGKNICIEGFNKHVQRLHAEYRKKVNKKSGIEVSKKLPKAEAIKVLSKDRKYNKLISHIGKKVLSKAGQSSKVLLKNIDFQDAKYVRKKGPSYPTKQLTFKCTKCSTLYTARSSLMQHIRKKHPQDRSCIQINEQKPARINKNQFEHYKSLLPKHVTYKCVKCKVHQLCAVGVERHTSCTKSPKVTCDICNAILFSRDQDFHKQQHELSDSIKTHKFSENIYSKILCKCWECNVYFEERPFLRHRFEGCSGTAAKYCAVCRVKVENLHLHSSRHTKKKPSRSDFVFIDHFFAPKGLKNKSPAKTSSTPNRLKIPKSVELKKSLKRKLPPPVNPTPDNKDKKSKPIFYYCELCKTFCKYYKCKKYHVTKLCLSQKSRVAYCPHCGLPFRAGQPMASHKANHAKFQWKLKDFVFLNFGDGKTISPPLIKFPACQKCNVQCMSSFVHSCEDSHKICGICNESFDQVAFKLHRMHHKYIAQSSKMDDVSELIQKYESLQSTWDIVYQCSTCNLATDSYDRAVEHSQCHLASATLKPTQKCDVCSLEFEETSIKKHRELHANEDITRSSFNILTFKCTDLLTDSSWFKLFKSLSRAKMKQITSPSIYVTRSVKMNVILNGPPEFSIYKCESCRNYVDASCVLTHTHSCDGKSSSHACQICGISFSSADGLNRHHKIHANSNITANSYRIISFNSKTDKEFNMMLKTTEEPSKEDSDDEVETSDYKFTFYQCKKCKSCSDRDFFIKKHKCLLTSGFWSCQKCRYISTLRNKNNHIQWHVAYKDLTRKDIRFVPFNKFGLVDIENEKDSNVFEVTLFKCTCGLHFTSEISLEKHAQVCSPDVEVSSENCGQCGLKFPTDVLVTHLCSHHRRKHHGTTKFIVKTEDDVANDGSLSVKKGVTQKRSMTCTYEGCTYGTKLYKCWCELHFLTSGAYFDHSNITRDHMRLNREHCPECGLEFTQYSLKRHVKVHHEMMGLKLKDFDVKTQTVMKRKDGLVRSKQTDRNTIYECGTCHVYFLKSFSAKIHVRNCPKVIEKSKKCDICGLLFSEKSLRMHRAEHHNMRRKYTLKDFHVMVVDKPERNKAEVESDSKVTAGDESNLNAVSVKLYKCSDCGLHYSNVENLEEHRLGEHDEDKVGCDACGLAFTVDELLKHKSLHHDDMNLKLEDFDVITNEAVGTSTNETLDSMNMESEVDTSETIFEMQKSTSPLYKCVKCDVHYLKYWSVLRHIAKRHAISKAVHCDRCGLKFSDRSLSTHQKVHHRSRGSVIIDIITALEYHKSDRTAEDLPAGKSLYKCVMCDVHFLSLNALVVHMSNDHHKLTNTPTCDVCGLIFTKVNFPVHMKVHHEEQSMQLEDFDIQMLETTTIRINDNNKSLIDVSQNFTPNKTQFDKDDVAASVNTSNCAEVETVDSVKTASQMDKSEILDNCEASDESAVSQSSDLDTFSIEVVTKGKDIIKLYKCGECNVFFLNQSSVYKHNLNHMIMDSKEYIECKLCTLQFRIMTLAPHIKKHHSKNFDLSDVLVEEYHPKKKGQKTPKIDIYYAIDKVQSRLVSTTTEDEKVEAGKSTPDVTQSNIDDPTDAASSVNCDVLEKDISNVLVEKDGSTTPVPNDLGSVNDSTNVILPTTSELERDSTILSSVLEKDEHISVSSKNIADDTSLDVELDSEPANSEALERDDATPELLSLVRDSDRAESMKCSFDDTVLDSYKDTNLVTDLDSIKTTIEMPSCTEIKK